MDIIFANAFNCLEHITCHKLKLLHDNFNSFEEAWQAGAEDYINAGFEKEIAQIISEEKQKIDPEKEFQKIILWFAEELKKIRTGRATSSVLEGVMVESYGALSPLAHAAALSSPDPKSVLIRPWDKNLLPAIEQALAVFAYGNLPLQHAAARMAAGVCGRAALNALCFQGGAGGLDVVGVGNKMDQTRRNCNCRL